MRIDVHAHYWTDAYLDMLVGLGRSDTATQRGIGASGGAEIDARLRLMDAQASTSKCSPPRRNYPTATTKPAPLPRHATSTTSTPRWCRHIRIGSARSRPHRCRTSMPHSLKFRGLSTNWAWSG